MTNNFFFFDWECSYVLIQYAVIFYPTVIPKDPLQRPNGIEVIDLDGDGTTTVLHIPTVSDQIVDSLTAHKNEVRTRNCQI